MPATASNYYISKFYHHALRCGLDADGLLGQAGIDVDIIDVPGKRIEPEKLAMVVVGIWDALQDEAMCLSASRIPRGSFYMMGKLTVHEPNLRKALEQLIRFYGVVTEAYTMHLSTEGDRALLTFELRSRELDTEHLLAEIHLMAIHRYISWLIAENVTLNDVFFSYPIPPQVKEYSFLFPGKHVFDAPSMGFSFSKKFLDCENIQNAGTLKIFMRRCPVNLFLRPITDFSLASEVRALLLRHVQDGFPTIREAAEYLHLTRRSLMRKLKAEGSTFQQIKDQVRRDRAIYFLTSQTLSVSEIAEKVGFSDPSVFTRAFKSWTGLAPRQYRENHLQKQAISE
jgi:AraC-like DNA-binding protein